jgi:hypothetical protein
MWIAALVALLLIAWWITGVNARYAAREAQSMEGPDARVEALWDHFGIGDAPEQSAAQVDALLSEVVPRELKSKHAVVVLAIMAARTGHHDVLEALATRAAALDGGCGETAALGVLSAAYAGDVALARERHMRSQEVISGCASCGASSDAKILMQEVALALDALESGALTRT